MRKVYRDLVKSLSLSLTISIFLFEGCTPSESTILDSIFEDTSSSSESDYNATNQFVTTVSIAYLKSLYSSNSLLISSDIAVEGVITANDAFGEFPSSIVIEDESGAIEIMCDLDSAISGYNVGATVQVSLSGMWLGSTGGMLAIGDAPYDQVAVSELSEEDMLRGVVVTSTPIITPIPKSVTIPYIDQDYILRYVVINSLSVVSDEGLSTTFCTRNIDTGLTEYTSHTLVDLQGNTIALEVDRNVIYADDILPTDPRSIYAIVEYFNGEYQLRIVNCGY